MSATAEQPTGTTATRPAHEGSRRPGSPIPLPVVVVAAAFAAGVVLAKLVDWMGHGHPRH